MLVDHELHASVITAYEGDAAGLKLFYNAFCNETERDLLGIEEHMKEKVREEI